MIEFSILITTKNRLGDLKSTLEKIRHLIDNQAVECIVCDDGSSDGTFDFVRKNYPRIELLKNEDSKGLIASRNMLLNTTRAKYAISLDDDANFLSKDVLVSIRKVFETNPDCAVQAFRIYWGKAKPVTQSTNQKPKRVKGFVGCGHAWRVQAWRVLPDYPEWFVFYGEEEFASFHIFRNNLQVVYNPNVLVHHRVDVKGRKYGKDYYTRLRKSLRAGWYLYALFYPVGLIPKKIMYTLWMQIKLKVFNGDIKALSPILLAFFDLVVNSPKYFKRGNVRLTKEEFTKFEKLENTKIYWKSNV